MDIGEVTDGYRFEQIVLKRSSEEVDKKINRLVKKRTKFHKAVSFVKEIQPLLGWDPKNPSTEIAAIIFKTIAASLGKHSGGLCFYSAVGTILDYRYSTDCFFSLELGNKESLVTVDLTISRNKHSKADIIISVDDVRNDNFYNIARVIAKKLLIRMYSKINRRRCKKTPQYRNKYSFK